MIFFYISKLCITAPLVEEEVEGGDEGDMQGIRGIQNGKVKRKTQTFSQHFSLYLLAKRTCSVFIYKFRFLPSAFLSLFM